MISISHATPDDESAVEVLLDQSFGSKRHLKTSYRYRDGVESVPDLRLVGKDGDALVATVRFWPVMVGAAAASALLLGPLAVAAGHQGSGIGSAMMKQSLEAAAAAGHRVVLLVGDIGYYSRFGFVPATPHGIEMPLENPARLLVRELAPGALQGMSGVIKPWYWAESSARRVA